MGLAAIGAVTQLYRVSAPHYVCGIVVTDSRVTYTAPIMRWCRGWTIAKVQAWCAKKRYKCELV